jgi:hypothetical protein
LAGGRKDRRAHRLSETSNGSQPAWSAAPREVFAAVMTLFGRKRVALLAIAALLFAVSLSHGATLVWDQNTEEDLAGYRVYVTSQTFQFPPIETQRNNFHTLTNLPENESYLIYVTAYNTNGFESWPSRVVQFPPAERCQYAMFPESAYLTPWSASSSFRVVSPSSCTWFASASHDWIHVTSAPLGDGVTEVFYTVEQNSSFNARAGVIQVGDRTFEIYQSAAGFGPVITSHAPTSAFVREGDTLTIGVEATDDSEVRYQWYQDEMELQGATNNILTIPGALPENAGSYTVEVSNAARTLYDGPVDVRVYAKPRILEGGQPKTAPVEIGDSVYLYVAAIGPDLRYEWFRNGISFRNDDSPVFFRSSVSSNDFGVYRVRVWNSAGSEMSEPASISAGDPEQLAGKIEIRAQAMTDVLVEANGIPGDAYEVQASTDLQDWFTLEVITVGESGRFEIWVPTPSAIGRWFVRTVRQRPAFPGPQ